MFVIDFGVILRCFQIHQFTLFLFALVSILFICDDRVLHESRWYCRRDRR